ncbi:ATP-binding protein [Streptomyces antibioticus]|uniref:ATP-binding protein n=1 Tax=Streptomyces antibioticus TaxID=1890 RepID=UPI0022503417|nr:ATP-binding protein [Streptomyces antibioticus]MCX4739045.1 ATP-binding protein [Streptomyces antibioticus]
MTVTSTPTTVESVHSALLPSVPASAGVARHLVSNALHAWDMNDLDDVATLIVTELVANSVDHTPCRRLRVVVSRPSRHIVRIGVADGSHALPEMGVAAADAEQGRGLMLIDALSWRWGSDRHDWGKSVWADLRVETPS